MIEHILVPLDGSPLAECVLPHVVASARALGARVTLLRVLDEMTESGGVPISPVNWHLVRARGEHYLADVAQRLAKAGCQVETVLVEGNAAEEILSFADQNNVHLIIFSSHGRSGLYRWNTSSVVQKVIFETKTSILLVRAYRAVDALLDSFAYKKILVPLDCSQRAECVLPIASQLVAHGDGQLLLAHVVVPPPLPKRTPLTERERALIAEMTDLNWKIAEGYLQSVRERVGVPAEIYLVTETDVAGALHDLMDAEEPDLVVLCAHGYTGARRWPFASLALNLIVYGTVPLLVVQDIPQREQFASWAEIASKEKKGH